MEKQKSGVNPENVTKTIYNIRGLENTNLIGFMCIPLFDKDPRPYFQKMKIIFDEIDFELLSMGMTNDYKIAIEKGSNI